MPKKEKLIEMNTVNSTQIVGRIHPWPYPELGPSWWQPQGYKEGVKFQQNLIFIINNSNNNLSISIQPLLLLLLESTSDFKPTSSNFKMHFTTFSVLAIAASMVSAAPTSDLAERDTCVNGLLCCPQLKTPLDPILDPLLGALGINGSGLVGSIGLLCKSHSLLTISPLLRLLTSPF